jgi:DNA-directed RNA polymerase beta' subunit
MKLRKINSITNFNPENVITSPDIYSRKSELINQDGTNTEVKIFADDSLFSKRIFGDLNTQNEYSCKCEKFTGKLFEGVICDICNSQVELVEANIDKIGWIDLKDFYIIKYISYMLLEKVIGRENLRMITKSPDKITIDGNIDLEEVKKVQSQNENQKYWFIGTQEFKSKYLEVLDYYHKLNEEKEKKSYEFLKDSDDIFTNKIPVISIVLRPAMRTADGLKMDELNNIYINILTSVKILDDKTNNNELSKIITLEALQAQYFQLSQEILENVKSKGGLIRNQIMGTRINFSARNIISPAKAGYKIDEVVLPYLTFLNLYKYELINTISRIKEIKIIEAEKLWYKATLKLDEEIHMIMKKMIMDQEVAILLNRNPTISYGSILYLKITGIKKDYNDLTMSIHNGILSLLAGDYDGDVLNIISIKDNETRKICKEVFSPINLIIDSNDGNFNTALNLERDQVLGLNNLLL